MTIWKQTTGLKATFLTLKCHAKMLMKRVKKEKKVQNVFPIHFKMCVWGGGGVPTHVLWKEIHQKCCFNGDRLRIG